jgi:sporulation protein YlmC with PRC-barrel domain
MKKVKVTNKSMPIINGKNLIGLPVETVLGKKLGKVFDFELEIDSQSILKYFVKGNILKDLFISELIIHRSQVISINDKKMIVKDNVIEDKQKIQASAPAPAV